jgi:hypothetical protein
MLFGTSYSEKLLLLSLEVGWAVDVRAFVEMGGFDRYRSRGENLG